MAYGIKEACLFMETYYTLLKIICVRIIAINFIAKTCSFFIPNSDEYWQLRNAIIIKS